MFYLAALLIAAVIGVMYLKKRRKQQELPTQEFAANVQRHVADPAALRQNLRLKVGYNESTIDRLIELERERLPNAPLQTLMEAAIERWERENR